MNIRLGRMPWAIGWLFWASSLAMASPPSADEVARLIQELNADDFNGRESAVRKLTAAGETAIGPLVRSISEDGPEARWRATVVLQRMAAEADAAAFAKIVTALRHENELHGQKLTALINDLSARRTSRRRIVAHEKIRAFGGRFGGDESEAPLAAVKQTDVPLPEPPPDLPLDSKEQGIDASQTPVLIADAYVSPLLANDVFHVARGESLTIDQNWRGGDEGLAPLCDLPELSALNLSRAPLTDAALETIAQMPSIQSLEIEEMPFSPAAIAKFRSRQPRTRVVARGSLLEVSAER